MERNERLIQVQFEWHMARTVLLLVLSVVLIQLIRCCPDHLHVSIETVIVLRTFMCLNCLMSLLFGMLYGSTRNLVLVYNGGSINLSPSLLLETCVPSIPLQRRAMFQIFYKSDKEVLEKPVSKSILI